jgi:hypothetical protein
MAWIFEALIMDAFLFVELVAICDILDPKTPKYQAIKCLK